MRRVPELDGVRGLAALAIVIFHYYTSLIPFGWAAVDLFFVLSGYLITSNILQYKDSPKFLAKFYARRALRIWPIYYLSVVALVLIGPHLPHPTRLSALPYVLTFSQNISHYWGGAVAEFSWCFNHTWTLAIEEQFYLAWPVLVVLAGRRGLVPVALLLLSVSVLARACGLHCWTLLGRSDGFALGAVLSVLLLDRDLIARRFPSLRKGFVLGSIVSLSYLALMYVQGGLPIRGIPRRPALTVLAINLLFFGVVGLVVCHAGRPALRALRSRSLRYLGQISYGLYLYHMIILRIKLDMETQLGLRHDSGVKALALVISFALAVLSWHFVERPILSFKSRFEYVGSAEVVVLPFSLREPRAA